jgi:predicted aconitase with swiveling domain
MPPRTKPSPSAHLIESIREVKYRIPAAVVIENTERKIVAFVAILNAAPVLKTN